MVSKELKSWLAIIFFGFCLVIIQSVWLSRLSFLSSFPNLILILIVLTGIFKGPFWGSFAGGSLGLVLGLLDQHFFLTFSLWLCCGLIFGLLKSNIFSDQRFLSALACFFGTWLSYFLYWGLSALFLKEAYYTPLETPLYGSLLNSLCAYLLYPLFARILTLNDS